MVSVKPSPCSPQVFVETTIHWSSYIQALKVTYGRPVARMSLQTSFVGTLDGHTTSLLCISCPIPFVFLLNLTFAPANPRSPLQWAADRDVILQNAGGTLERMLVFSSTRILGTYCKKPLYPARDLSAMASTKRQRDSDGEVSPPKKFKTGKESEPAPKVYNRIASLHNATAVNKNPPVAQLQNALKSVKTPNTVDPGECVVYWMRMGDLRSMASFITHFHPPLNSRHS